jgi:hypothetical protein
LVLLSPVYRWSDLGHTDSNRALIWTHACLSPEPLHYAPLPGCPSTRSSYNCQFGCLAELRTLCQAWSLYHGGAGDSPKRPSPSNQFFMHPWNLWRGMGCALRRGLTGRFDQLLLWNSWAPKKAGAEWESGRSQEAGERGGWVWWGCYNLNGAPQRYVC